jgi:hypothetical protein
VFTKTFCSLLLFAIGIAVVYFCGRTTTLECTRDRAGVISADIIRRGINYCKKERILPGELIRAELDSLSKSKQAGTYRIRLVLSSYTVFMTRMYSLGNNPTSKVARINYFIETASLRSISIAQDDRLSSYLIGSILWLAGINVLMIRIP